jgi:cell division protein FtsW (lipid II flippase)
MATTFAICAVFVPVAFMKGIVGKFFFPFGITVAVAVLVSLFVSFTLDPMLSSIWRDPPTNRLLKVPVLGHLMRGTDRSLDVLHGIYERCDPLDLLRPPLSRARAADPGVGPAVRRRRPARQERAAALALRDRHAARAGAARRDRQLRRRDRCWRRWSAPSSSRKATTATSR